LFRDTISDGIASLIKNKEEGPFSFLGTKTNNLDQMLNKIADFYEEEVEA
jgi:hypothetical protein